MPEGDGTPPDVSKTDCALLVFPPTDIRVFLALTLATDKATGRSFASMDTVVAWAGMPRRTFFDSLKRLKAAGLYRRFRRGRWGIANFRPGARYGYITRDALELFGIARRDRQP